MPRATVMPAGMTLLAIVLVSLLWRLPSLFDPPWVNDEGTYFAVAQAMAHGYRLYVDIWENKPPGIYLLYSAVYHPFGPSLIGIRVIAGVLATVIVSLTYRLALRPAGRTGASAAALFAGLLLGVPFLEGTTLNAELPLAALSACAIYAALEWERPSLAGVLMVAALAFKAVAAFDATALGIWLLLHHRQLLPRYLGGAAAGAALATLVLWRAGILASMGRDALLYDLGYVSHGNGGAIPWLLTVKVLLLLVATVTLRRAPLFYLWFVWSAMGVLFSGRVFGHYTVQALAPLAVSGAILLRRHLRPPILILLPCAFLVMGLASAIMGWGFAETGHDSILARRLQYYANFARYAMRRESYQQYETQIDDQVVRNQRVASDLMSLPAGPLLVWGNSPWIYPLSGRLPATPYTSSLRQPAVPGESMALRQAVARYDPVVVVVIEPPSPSLGSARSSLRRYYRMHRRMGSATIYVRDSSF